MTRVYDTSAWRDVRDRAIERDGNRCTVARLLGGDCSGVLHVHHIVPVAEGGAPFDVENTGTSCSRHHPVWEATRRAILRARRRDDIGPCRHRHRYDHARRECRERRRRAAA